MRFCHTNNTYLFDHHCKDTAYTRLLWWLFFLATQRCSAVWLAIPVRHALELASRSAGKISKMESFSRRSANDCIKKIPYIVFQLLCGGCISDLAVDIVNFLLMSCQTAILDSAVNGSACCAFWSRATLLCLANLFYVLQCKRICAVGKNIAASYSMSWVNIMIHT